mmetsp:Transcript_15800/g.22581  ORF Transcript_15800/g.22581 Transcript_15800/m.22581 type:complete len:457 (-) Transcript_15800:486-1856(-)
MRKILLYCFILLILQTVVVKSQLRGNNENHNRDADRGLLVELWDPKTVVEKKTNPYSEVGVWKYPLNPATLKRPMRILAFGASVTWGAALHDRHHAFPWLLGEPFLEHVDNLSMRATGADYPSICLESMIPDAETKEYDVILLEFNKASSNGFHLLIKRLRERFPDAVIILVHLWGLITVAVEKESGLGPTYVGLDPHRNWVWMDGDDTFNPNGNKEICDRDICDGHVMEQLVKEAGGYVYKLPLPENPKIAIDEGWFASDWHHLSHTGHKVVTDGILEILSQHQGDIFKGKRLGSFGLGDQCFSWFMDGDVKLEYDGEVKLLGPKENSEKWVVEIDPVNGGSLSFHSKFPFPVPVGLSYMSKREGSNYTVVEVTLNDNAVSIDPNYNLFPRPFVHIAVLYQIGWAHPGKNRLTVRTVDHRGKPFRIVGVYLCGVCAETGNMGSGALNYAGVGEPK